MSVLHLCVCTASMYVYMQWVPGAWCPRRPKEGTGSPELELSPCGCWKHNSRAELRNQDRLLLDKSQKGGIEGSHQGKQKQPSILLEAP